MSMYGLDIDVATHEFAKCKLERLERYKSGGWRVIAVITDPPIRYGSNERAIFILARKNNSSPYR